MSRTRSRSTKLAMIAFWVLPSLVATVGMTLVPSRLRPDLSLSAVFLTQLALWIPWALWTFVVFAVGDRFPLRRGRLLPGLLVHLALSVVVVAAQIWIAFSTAEALGLHDPLPLTSRLMVGLRSSGDLFTVIYWGIVVAHGALDWSAAYREQQLRSLRLETDLVESQLHALQAQLRPHFLFNAINSVVAMIDRDPKSAQRMLIRLADLLRATLRSSGAQQIPLEQELELTRLYLEVEQARFGNRLTIAWDVQVDPSTLIPALTLQPLVENAVAHGVARKAGPGRIEISIRPTASGFVATVTDNGPGPGAEATPRAHAGVGLSNLRQRLERLFGERAALELTAGEGGGAVASVRVPASRPS
jgi:two-component sensor histidine kinase